MQRDSPTLENVTEFTNSSSAGSTCCYCRKDYCRCREANWYLVLPGEIEKKVISWKLVEEWWYKFRVDARKDLLSRCWNKMKRPTLTTKFYKVSNIYNIKFHYRAPSILDRTRQERLSAFRIRKHACVLSVCSVVAKKDETCCSFYWFAFGFEDRRVLYIMELGRLFGRMSLPFSLLLAMEKGCAIVWSKDLGS